ncbi:MAG: acetoacetate--CoA ligase [Pseudomonadota bacterium]
MIESPTALWRPDAQLCANANVTRFAAALGPDYDGPSDDYAALWQWSVDDPGRFWRAVARYYDVLPEDQCDPALADATMPGAQWFPNATLNYVDVVWRHAGREGPAVLCQPESGELISLSWAELQRQAMALANTLRGLGVERGDRVVAYLNNVPECIVAFHAVAALGATWSVCSPDLGAQGVLDRFQQIEPKVLIACDGYHYGGRDFARADVVAELVDGLPTLAGLVSLERIGGTAIAGVAPADARLFECVDWQAAIAGDAVFEAEPVAFDHPLWIVYSSGTTGRPKAIVHGHGGIVLEHLKQVGLQLNLNPGDRFMWFSSTAWMMWNYNIAGLLMGVTVCLYDGNPGKPDLNRLWQVVEALEINFFGAGAAYFEACKNAGLAPGKTLDLKWLFGMGSTGSPLAPDVFDWIYETVGSDVFLSSISGGTDFATACVGGAPTVPVWRGEISCRSLGCAVEAWDEAGNAVTDTVGELVITAPMPSMPLMFWNDGDGSRYRDAYFDTYPGVWRHGDWIRITDRGSAVIYGRSDSTINRQGIRMGTAELYQVVEALPEVLDSLVVDLEYLGRDSYLPLFVVLAEGAALDDALITAIRTAVRTGLSPRHVPDDVFAIADVPRTFSGKKMEIPVRRLLLGKAAAEAINRDTMANPESIDWFVDFALQLAADRN